MKAPITKMKALIVPCFLLIVNVASAQDAGCTQIISPAPGSTLILNNSYTLTRFSSQSLLRMHVTLYYGHHIRLKTHKHGISCVRLAQWPWPNPWEITVIPNVDTLNRSIIEHEHLRCQLWAHKPSYGSGSGFIWRFWDTWNGQGKRMRKAHNVIWHKALWGF